VSRIATKVELSHGLFDRDVRTVVIGVGAQKSGTTWLAAQLARHVNVHMREKEVHYWDVVRSPYIRWDKMAWQGGGGTSPTPRIKKLARSFMRKPKDRGEELFGADPVSHVDYANFLSSGRTGQAVVSEVTPAYSLCSASTFAEMIEIHPDVRFVFLMRDPVDRLWSGVKQRFRPLLTEDSKLVREGRHAAALEKAFLRACDDVYDPDYRRSRYDETITALEMAGANAIFMFYETLFTKKSINRLGAFLGLDGLEARFDQRVYGGLAGEVELSAIARRTARESLAGTYDYVRSRFGAEVPEQWMT
jgi:hypothetical protein